MTGAAAQRQLSCAWLDVLVAIALGAMALAVHNATFTPSYPNKRGV